MKHVDTNLSIPVEFLQHLSEEQRLVVASNAQEMEMLATKQDGPDEGNKNSYAGLLNDYLRMTGRKLLEDIPLLILLLGCLLLLSLPHNYPNPDYGGLPNTKTNTGLTDNAKESTEIYQKEGFIAIDKKQNNKNKIRLLRRNVNNIISGRQLFAIGNAGNFREYLNDNVYISDGNITNQNADDCYRISVRDITALELVKKVEADLDADRQFNLIRYPNPICFDYKAKVIDLNTSLVKESILRHNLDALLETNTTLNTSILIQFDTVSNIRNLNSFVNVSTHSHNVIDKVIPTLSTTSHSVIPLLVSMFAEHPQD